MAELMRFGVSMDEGLLERFDAWVDAHGWANRSEAIRDLVRRQLVDEEWNTAAGDVIATLTYVYDHHVTDLQERLTEMQHTHHGLVLSSMHVHLDHDHCVEVLVMHGPPADLRALADGILGAKGVKHGQLVRASMAEGL
ncbi:MAG: nickel-responsive transcriptional regulator NikR [Deltaproteobacteria bacterium]|nr:nickel-responsive transcriptional regulator NikR [Deltaproteobacteria bacterium]